jgi:ribosome biogenesis protein Nip4
MIRDLYPEETRMFLKESGLEPELDLIEKNVHILVDKVDSFGIDFKNKSIQISSESEQITAPLKDVGEFIRTKLQIDSASWEYHLALSCLIQADTYEKFQLVYSLILED